MDIEQTTPTPEATPAEQEQTTSPVFSSPSVYAEVPMDSCQPANRQR